MSDQPRLLEQVRRAMRVRRYSPRTEEAYVNWVRRFVRHHGMRHPAELGPAEIGVFLTRLAAKDGVAAATHRAPPSLGGVHRRGAGAETGEDSGRPESKRGSATAEGAHRGGSARLSPPVWRGAPPQRCLQLRVKDVDFARRQLIIRRGKGAKDRMTVLPDAARVLLRDQLERARALHRADLERGAGRVAPLARVRGAAGGKAGRVRGRAGQAGDVS
jgi:integrase-like protein